MCHLVGSTKIKQLAKILFSQIRNYYSKYAPNMKLNLIVIALLHIILELLIFALILVSLAVKASESARPALQLQQSGIEDFLSAIQTYRTSFPLHRGHWIVDLLFI